MFIKIFEVLWSRGKKHICYTQLVWFYGEVNDNNDHHAGLLTSSHESWALHSNNEDSLICGYLQGLMQIRCRIRSSREDWTQKSAYISEIWPRKTKKIYRFTRGCLPRRSKPGELKRGMWCVRVFCACASRFRSYGIW